MSWAYKPNAPTLATWRLLSSLRRWIISVICLFQYFKCVTVCWITTSMSVLPVPVAAQAHRSLPSRPTGTQAFWMGVGCLKPRAVMACEDTTGSQTVTVRSSWSKLRSPLFSWGTSTLINNREEDLGCGYLQDGSGKVHVTKGQLIVVLRRIFIKRLWGLKKKKHCYHGNTVLTMNEPVISSVPLPHLVSLLPLSPTSLFVSQGVWQETASQTTGSHK